VDPNSIALLGIIIAAITGFFTISYTVITLFLWLSTRKAVQLNARMVEQLVIQVNHQIALSHTASEHNIIDSHRELFLSVLQDEKLLEIFASDAKIAPDNARKNILGTFLINHCATIFYYHANKVISDANTENFVRDAKDLFDLPFLRKRWAEVKEFHSKAFQTFVDDVLLTEADVDFRLAFPENLHIQSIDKHSANSTK
jgi:hypothetical protein